MDSIPHAKDLLNLYFESGSYGDSNFCGFRLCFMNSEVNNNTWLNTNRQRFLKKLGAEISADEDIEKFLQSEAGQPYNALIEKQRQIIGHLDMKYQQFSKQHEVLYEEIDRYDNLKKQINAKYSIEFLSSIANLLTDRDLNKINEYGAKGDYEGFIRFFYDFDCYHTIFKSLQYGSLIEAFSSEKSRALESVETSRFMKNTIINDRLEYFKRMGLNDDNKTYEELMKCLDVKNVPDAKMVDSFIECRLKYQEMANDEYFRLSSDYASIEKKFNDMDLVYDSDITIADLSSGCQYTSPNVRKDNLDVVGVFYYSPLKTLEGYADVQFIHEINHVIELNLIEIKNNEPVYRTGFCTYNNDGEVSNKEQFSETVNQDIAMGITKMMHDDGFYIFDNPKYSKIKGSTEYEHNNVIVGDFYNMYRQEIIDSRVSNSLLPLTSIVGEDNFERLNATVNEFCSLPFLNVMMDIRNNKDTPLRNKGLDLINTSSEIITSMQSYSSNASYGSK